METWSKFSNSEPRRGATANLCHASWHLAPMKTMTCVDTTKNYLWKAPQRMSGNIFLQTEFSKFGIVSLSMMLVPMILWILKKISILLGIIIHYCMMITRPKYKQEIPNFSGPKLHPLYLYSILGNAIQRLVALPPCEKIFLTYSPSKQPPVSGTASRPIEGYTRSKQVALPPCSSIYYHNNVGKWHCLPTSRIS